MEIETEEENNFEIERVVAVKKPLNAKKVDYKDFAK